MINILMFVIKVPPTNRPIARHIERGVHIQLICGAVGQMTYSYTYYPFKLD